MSAIVVPEVVRQTIKTQAKARMAAVPTFPTDADRRGFIETFPPEHIVEGEDVWDCLVTEAESEIRRFLGVWQTRLPRGRSQRGLEALLSSKTDEWATPQSLFDSVNAELGPFELDVCATSENAKCKRYFTKASDGLRQPWIGKCWMNPPYGHVIRKWMKKAYESCLEGATVVCLVPARTDTGWWHNFSMKGEIRYLRGRIKFGNAKNSAPFPSALVIFRGSTTPKENQL